MMDQVTLLGKADLPALPLHQSLTLQNLPFIKRTIYVYESSLEDSIRQLHKTFESSSFLFVNEKELLDLPRLQNKWIYQQLLKLNLDQLQKKTGLTEPFLITDVDTLPLRTLKEEKLKHQGKVIFWVGLEGEGDDYFADDFSNVASIREINFQDPHQMSWLYGFTWSSLNLLGIDDLSAMSAVNACVIWYSDILRKLRQDIESRFQEKMEVAILSSFELFIQKHAHHFYRDASFKEVLFSVFDLAPRKPLQKTANLSVNLRTGFSEWQLYLYYLSQLTDHPYQLHFQSRNRNHFIKEYNYLLLGNAPLEKMLAEVQGSNTALPYWLNFYPKLSPEHISFLGQKYGVKAVLTTV